MGPRGLAICQEIVQSLGGTLVQDNRRAPDGHTTGLNATVRLPLADPSSPDLSPSINR